MTFLREFNLGPKSANDAFGRIRTSDPFTIFDSKQIYDQQPLFWDESLESGSGISSAHSSNTASTVITSTANTAGKFTRQTFMRFNYQPGKSQLIMMTGVLDNSGGGTGVKRRIGYFDDNNGLFFEEEDGVVKVVRRTNVTGTPVDNAVEQSLWNADPMDGSGPSSLTIDWSKFQIFIVDFSWLGGGTPRMCIKVNGETIVVHQFSASNTLSGVYMSTPNLPLRYQIETTASSPQSSLKCICGTVISEGGAEHLGVDRYASTGSSHVNANTAGTFYAIKGIRLKSSNLGARVEFESVSIHLDTADNFEWKLIMNPTIAGSAPTFNDETNSSVQTADGDTAGNPSVNTVTGGTVLEGGFGSQGSTITPPVDNAIHLGSSISGVVDEIWLCVMPLTSNADVHGGLVWREVP